MSATRRRTEGDDADRPELVGWNEGPELVIAEAETAGAWIALSDKNNAVEVRQ